VTVTKSGNRLYNLVCSFLKLNTSEVFVIMELDLLSRCSEQDTGCAAVESWFYSRQGKRFLCCPERPDRLWNASSTYLMDNGAHSPGGA
jgi:hypothetical protein